MRVDELNPTQCWSELSQAPFGRLACAMDNQPYIVPIRFAVDGDHLYAFSMAGRKIAWMRANPLICLQVDRVVSEAEWVSVTATGKYLELLEADDDEQRQHAHDLLQHCPNWWEPGTTMVATAPHDRSLLPIYFRIDVLQLTGRHHLTEPDSP